MGRFHGCPVGAPTTLRGRRAYVGPVGLESEGFDEAFDGEPIFAFAAVGRVGPSVHLEGLSDGT